MLAKHNNPGSLGEYTAYLDLPSGCVFSVITAQVVVNNYSHIIGCLLVGNIQTALATLGSQVTVSNVATIAQYTAS
jgi:hypothetical protein